MPFEKGKVDIWSEFQPQEEEIVLNFFTWNQVLQNLKIAKRNLGNGEIDLQLFNLRTKRSGSLLPKIVRVKRWWKQHWNKILGLSIAVPEGSELRKMQNLNQFTMNSVGFTALTVHYTYSKGFNTAGAKYFPALNMEIMWVVSNVWHFGIWTLLDLSQRTSETLT